MVKLEFCRYAIANFDLTLFILHSSNFVLQGHESSELTIRDRTTNGDLIDGRTESPLTPKGSCLFGGLCSFLGKRGKKVKDNSITEYKPGEGGLASRYSRVARCYCKPPR